MQLRRQRSKYCEFGLRDQTQSINQRAIFKLDTGDGEWYKHRHMNIQGEEKNHLIA